jgi:hypothetical protein
MMVEDCMKTILASVLLFLCSSAYAQDKPPLLATVDVMGDFVSVHGYWEPDNPTKHNELVPTENDIQCFRHGGKEANIVRTEGYCIVATAQMVNGHPHAEFSFEAITSWTEDEIVISDSSSICLVTKTIIDLKRKTAIALDVRKPEARGFADTCKMLPDRQSYYLRDEVDYILFHKDAK